jgi:hypothetical protein
MTSLKQIESAAYHEAGHMTAAVVQGMPIRAAGLYVDLLGHGVANYFDRSEKDLGTTPLDIKELKLTMIALFAGQVAQVKFFPECDQSGWWKDLIRIGTFSRQLHPSDENLQISSRREFRERAKNLIDKHWTIVEELGKALLAKPSCPMPPEESAEPWGFGEVRHMTGEEVVEFFARHKVRTKIVDDATRDYDSTQDVPHYDSLS